MTPRDAFRLFPFAKKVYLALPRRLRAFVSPIGYFFYDLLNSLRPEAWCLTGEMQGSQLPISVCLFVMTAQSRSYVCKLIFGSSFQARYLGRTWVWNADKPHEAASGCAIVFSALHAPYVRLLRTGCGIPIPTWLYGEAELPRGQAAINSKSTKSALRRIRNNSLEFEITHDQRRFDDFYDNMYVAHIKRRYGDGAFVIPRKRVQENFDKGELLLIKKEGEYISGQLITYKGSRACLPWLGVRDGNWEHVRDGAEGASYEFSFRRAEEKGCQTMDLTRSRPFLNDGLLRFKRTLSQRIVGAEPHRFLLRILSDSQATRAFLDNTPFIFERFGQFHGAVFASGETPLTLEALRQINKQHFHAGMATLVVFQFSPGMAGAEDGCPPALPPDLSASYATDPSDPFRCKQMPRVDWTDLIKGLGFAGIGQAIAIYPKDEDRTPMRDSARQ
jgi:hypothetical protein